MPANRLPAAGIRGRPGFLGLALLATAVVGVAAFKLQGSSQAQSADGAVTATRGELVVSVRGVGRVVEAGGATQITVPGSTTASTAAGGSTQANGGGVPAGADAVFPRASGRIAKLLVTPGRRVVAGQPVAVLADDGSVASAVRQAQNDVAAAQLELRQKRTSDPLQGLPPSPAELEAARLAAASAQARLDRLLGRPLSADVSAAQLDVKRAVADLEALRGGKPDARARSIAVGRRNVQLAQQRLDRLLSPPSRADVSVAELELKKAEADLALLQRPAAPPSPEAVAAARQAVEAARLKLERLLGSPDPAAVSAARLDVSTAEANLVTLQAADPPASAQALAAAQQAVDTTRVRLDQLLAPPHPADVAAVQLERDRAVAELAALTQPQQQAAPEAVAAAQQAVASARLKLATLREPAAAADVTAARLELQRARSDLRTLQAGPSPAALAAARQAVDAARARLAQLLGPPTTADATTARLEVGRAKAELAVLEARGGPAPPTDVGLARLKLEAAQARLALGRFAQRQLTVRAPVRGTVTAVLTAPGAPVDASTPIATVAALDRLQVKVDLSEFDAANVRPGQPAVVSVDALGGKTYPGKVLFAAFTGVDNGGLVTFPVQVSLSRIDGLKPGMNVSVRIVVAKKRNVVQVPLEAVSRDGEDRPVVTVTDEAGEESIRRVQLGLTNNSDVEIAKGLNARRARRASREPGGGEGAEGEEE